ncbi:MAG: hypothetical protein EOO38_16765 [Cytophagaceae bacterium]|nr:MAG: hypothetical protein EOO38_16765 [Cytophagaceae bacterium]
MAPTMYWTIPETCIAVVGACLPTLRPLFYGWSPESILGSVRSALSLTSLSSKRSKNADNAADESRRVGQDSIGDLRGDEYGISAGPILDRSKVPKMYLDSQTSVYAVNGSIVNSGLNDDP